MAVLGEISLSLALCIVKGVRLGSRYLSVGLP